MTHNEAIDLLERYNKHLLEEGYADTDLWCEPPTALDKFMGSEWAKENLPIKLNITTVRDVERVSRPLKHD